MPAAAAPAAQVDIPFTAAAHRYREKIWTKTFVPGAATVDLSPPNGIIKPYGYLRWLDVLVTTTGGTVGPATASADFPWNVFSQVMVTQPNGQELYGGPLFAGFDAMLAAKHAAFQGCTDPALLPSAKLGASNLITFQFRLPIIFEMDRASGLGDLPNEDATAPWKITLIGNTATAIWGTQPTAAPTVQIDVFINCWTVPSPVNPITGLRQAIAPPGLGTIQKWTKQIYAVTPSSAQEILLSRKGNAIRTLIFKLTGAASARVANTNYPTAITFEWDGTLLRNADAQLLLVDDDYMVRGAAPGTTPQTNDVGVVVLKMADHAGVDVQGLAEAFGLDEFWGTVQSSVLGIAGTWGASATGLEVLTNDVQVVSLAGNPYAFAYAPYLQAPAQPPTRT